MNLIPAEIFHYVQDNLLERNRDRLAMACSMGVRYRELGGIAVARLRAVTMSKRQQEVEDATLARDRTRYRATRDEYRRCQTSGILGKGYHAVARDYGIPPVWLRHFNRGEY